MDDILFTSGNPLAIEALVLKLSTEFNMKDLGLVSYALGLEIVMDPITKRMSICQYKYTRDIIEQFGFTNLHPVSTPMETKTKLNASIPLSLNHQHISP